MILQIILKMVMIFAMLHRCPIRIVETYDLLPPTVCHAPVNILDFRVVFLQFLNEPFQIRFFKIEFTGIVLRDYFLTNEPRPIFLLLKNKPFCQDHVSIVIEYKFKSEQIMIKLSCLIYIFNHYQYIFQLHQSINPYSY